MRWRPASPTLDLLIIFGTVYILQVITGIIGIGALGLALALPLTNAPWTVVTSVYAHSSVSHLLANAVALSIVGFALERSTTRARFHAFVLGTGMIAGIAEVTIGGLLGQPTAVLGASGAILALVGYVITGNPITSSILGRIQLSFRAQLILVTGLVILVTLVTGGPGVALVAHAAGFILGLLSGRAHLLRVT